MEPDALSYSMVLIGIPSKVIDTITKKLGLQTAVERSTFNLAETIQPIVQADEKIIDVVETVSATGTIMTTPTTRDFFLTSVAIANAGDDQAGQTTDTISVILPSGATKIVLGVMRATKVDTSDSGFGSLVFPTPIKLKRGSAIAFVKATTTTLGMITGYEVD